MRTLLIGMVAFGFATAVTPASAQIVGWPGLAGGYSGGFGSGYSGGFWPGSSSWRRGRSLPYGPVIYPPVVAPAPVYGPYQYGYSYGYNYGDPFGYGYADAVRAQGEYNRNSADAAVVSEEARKKALENKILENQYLDERGRQYKQEQAAKYAVEKAAREQWLKNREPVAPARPTVLQLDQKTGKIYWPEVLLLDVYAPWRQRLDELFEARSDKTAQNRNAFEIRLTAKGLLQELKADVRRLPANDYLEAKRFVESLSWESQFAAGP